MSTSTGIGSVIPCCTHRNQPCTLSKWFSVALLVSSVIFIGGAILGGMGYFAPLSSLPQWLAYAAGPITQSGCLALCVTGSILGTISLAWLIKNVCQSRIHSLLLDAAEKGKTESFQKLLCFGCADVNATNEDGQTPLHLAAIKGHEELMRFLLHCEGIRVNATDDLGQPPLLCAVESNRVEAAVALLADSRTNVNLLDAHGRSLLHMTMNEAIAEALVRRSDFNIRAYESGETPLHLVVEKGFVTCVSRLLERENIDVNAKTSALERTPLHYAAWIRGIPPSKNRQIIEILTADPRTDLQATDNLGLTQADLAAREGRKELFSALSTDPTSQA